MRFRILSIEELETLEKEFVTFLSSQGIPADEWQKIKISKKKLEAKLIEQFSEMVLERILKNVIQLERTVGKQILRFTTEKKQITLNIIENNETISTQTKTYSKNREDELFELMNQGFMIVKQS